MPLHVFLYHSIVFVFTFELINAIYLCTLPAYEQGFQC
uniref:Uncharacterized protein n=1 Tax=Arundo donax TaxID=35708 RepID=A0A0A9B4M7_ARUDO